MLHLRDDPKVFHLYPTLGSTQGGTKVSVVGDSFYISQYSCIFDRYQVPAHLVSSSILLCLSPAAESSAVVVQISSVGIFEGGSSFPEFRYEYVAPLTCLEVSSSIVNVKRLNTILVRGKNAYRSRMLSCALFDGDQKWLHPATFISSTEIECQIAHHKDLLVGRDSVALKISNNAVEFSDCSHNLYLVDDNVIKVQPSSGPVVGGTRFLVSGTKIFDDTVHHVVCIICGKPGECKSFPQHLSAAIHRQLKSKCCVQLYSNPKQVLRSILCRVLNTLNTLQYIPFHLRWVQQMEVRPWK